MGYEEEILDSFANDDGEEGADGDTEEGVGNNEDGDGDEGDISDL